MKSAPVEQGSMVTAEDIAQLAAKHEALMRAFEEGQQKYYGVEIERELCEFDVRDLRARYASWPTSGIRA